jgi:hypothetical protein
MDRKNFDGKMPAPKDRPVNFRDCAESIYVENNIDKIDTLS